MALGESRKGDVFIEMYFKLIYHVEKVPFTALRPLYAMSFCLVVCLSYHEDLGPFVFLKAAYAASTTPNSVELSQNYAKVHKLCS